ncbi:MAG: hypothetical protein PHI34_13475 [Acidobacteriota bacterium]|nr:hypothetical protein [Acidobacteriota bacterium]
MDLIKRTIVFLWLATSLVPGIGAQLSSSTYQYPPGLHWKKITTPHFEVIVPEEILTEGQRAANTLEHVIAPLGKTLEQPFKRIFVVVSNQGIVSNGSVEPVLRMSEWSVTGSESGLEGVTDWYALLASHEGRRMVQIDKLNRGFTRLAGVVFGGLGRAFFSSLSVPDWFMEGDAVGLETALTGGGRGREPQFDMGIRTLLLSGRRFAYDKALLRSYKDWYPDDYHLGYLLTTHLRRRFSPLIWSKILDRTSTHSYYVFAFDQALKSATGMSVEKLYASAMDELKGLWRKQSDGLAVNSFLIKNSKKKHGLTSYIRGQYFGDGTIVAQKYGLNDAGALIRLKADGSEETIRRIADPGQTNTWSSARNGMVLWCQIDPDIRWGKRAYGHLYLLDRQSGRTRRLAARSRYVNAALSPDARRIAAVELTGKAKFRLVILDSAAGRILKEIPNQDGSMILMPSWSADGREVAFARQNQKGRGLAVADVETGSVSEILPPSRESVTQPVFFDRFILYHSPYSGIDNIYAVDRNTRRRWQVTSAAFGAFDPEVQPGGKTLLYSNFTADGFDLAESELDPGSWKPIEEVEPRSIVYYEPLIGQEQGGDIFGQDKIPRTIYPVSDYNSAKHLLNVHSWGFRPTSMETKLLLMSNDLLNKSSFTGGFSWNYNEKVLGFGLSGCYQALFPLIDLEAGYGGRTMTYTDEAGERQRYGWKETSLSTGLRLPFNLSRGATTALLSLKVAVDYKRISHKEIVQPYEMRDGDILPLQYRLSLNRFRAGTIRDLKTPWGQHLDILYRHIPWDSGQYHGALFSISGGVYLPGLAKHHSLHIQAAYEAQRPDNYRFESEFLFPRGYIYTFHERLAKISVDYSLPLAYPDLALGKIAYLKRFSLNIFYDYGQGQGGGLRTTYQSAGLEILTEAYFLRIPSPIVLGPRIVYCFTDRKVRFEPLVLGLSF